MTVDGRCRTHEQNVWALGDCIDTPQLAHVGFMEGINAIRDILGEDPTTDRLRAGAVGDLLPARGRLRRPD